MRLEGAERGMRLGTERGDERGNGGGKTGEAWGRTSSALPGIKATVVVSGRITFNI